MGVAAAAGMSAHSAICARTRGFLYNLNRQVLAETWVRQARSGERQAKRVRDAALERARRADSVAQAAVRERDAALERAQQSEERARGSDQLAQAALTERDAALERARLAGEAAQAAATERDAALERVRRAEEAAATALAQRDLARSEAEIAERTAERGRRDLESQRQAFADSVARLQWLLREVTGERDVYRDSTRTLASQIQQTQRDPSGEPPRARPTPRPRRERPGASFPGYRIGTGAKKPQTALSHRPGAQLPPEDSNLHQRFQRLLCCPYTTGHGWAGAPGEAGRRVPENQAGG
jgi:hypothetical protein